MQISSSPEKELHKTINMKKYWGGQFAATTTNLNQ